MKYCMVCCILYGLLLVVLASKEDGIDFCSWYREVLDCNKNGFRCLNGKKCIPSELYCNGEDDCGDNSDEKYCSPGSCPQGFINCAHFTPYKAPKCIPSEWRCNGKNDCEHGNDETTCNYYIRPKTPYSNWTAAEKVTKWVTEQRNELGNSQEKWGSSVDILALTLYYATGKFDISKANFSEMTNELTIRLLLRLSSKKLSDLPSTELASYVNAFLVMCINPRNFYGYDIVQEMRNRVDRENYTNPYVFLTLCNAREIITESDKKKLTDTFESEHRTFWTDTQAVVVMALACAKKQAGNDVDIVEFHEMMPKLKKQLHANDTGIDLPSKALILQAMISTHSESGHNNSEQIKTFQELLRNQKSDGSFGDVMDTFLVTPLLSCRSLVDINSDHCEKNADVFSEMSALNDLAHENGPTTRVQYSLWIGEKKNLERNLVLRVPQNTSVYGVMERAAEVDSRFRFKYSVQNKKPFINAISGIRDNPLTGKFWFLYHVQNKEATLCNKSPADIIPSDDDHYVMWYRRGTWVDSIL